MPPTCDRCGTADHGEATGDAPAAAARSLTVWGLSDCERIRALRDECQRALNEAFHDAARMGLTGWKLNKFAKDAMEMVRHLQQQPLQRKA